MVESSTERIVDDLRGWIRTAAPGARLPPSRELVARFRASPVTVQKAVEVLRSLGLVESRPGVGTFVRARPSLRPVDYSWQTAALHPQHTPIPPVPAAMRGGAPDAIGLHAGYPDPSLLPIRILRAALTRAARGEPAVARPDPAGRPALREWFAAELAAAMPAGVVAPTPRDVVVVPGSQSGLSSVFRAVVGARRPVILESPTYWGAVLGAAQAGVRVIAIASGPDGPDPAELDRAFTDSGARAFYAQPAHANPTGHWWPPDRAAAVLAVVRAHSAYLVEDDWAHDLGLDGPTRPLAAQDDAGHVIYLRSLSKSVSPAVRVAAVIARGPARERVLADRGAESIYVSDLLQAAALDVVAHPGWPAHLRGLRERLRERRNLLLDALGEHVPEAYVDRVPAGGLNLWARLPEGVDVDRLARDCEYEGLLVAPGTEWFPGEPTGPYLRLNYSGPAPERFAEAARVLGANLRRQPLP